MARNSWPRRLSRTWRSPRRIFWGAESLSQSLHCNGTLLAREPDQILIAGGGSGKDMTVQVLRRRFTVDEYYLMAKVGILLEDDRVELIEGEIVEMAPIGRYHASSVDRLTRLLSQGLGQRAILRVQSPIHLGEQSEPQPDISLLRPQDDFYASGHPGPEEVLLLIEVADTSTEYDRQVKLPLYARAGIREVWLVDLTANQVEVYRLPGPRGYRQILMPTAEDRLAPEALPDLELSPQDILAS